MIVYVATIPLKYEVIAVAETEAQAIDLATRKAHEFLKDAFVLTDETDTPQKIGEYFGVAVTRIAVGTAAFID